MRIGKIAPGLLSAVLICLILLAGFFEEPVEETAFAPSFFVYTEADGQKEQIHPWQDSGGHYWMFLPGYARLDETILISGSDTVSIDNIPVEEGSSLDRYEWNVAYPLSCSSEAGFADSTITFVRSGALPTLHLDVSSGSMDYIHMEKGNGETGVMRLYDADGRFFFSGELESVKGRGNTSWYADKKPYNLTLRQDADLLNMGSARRWILLSEGGNRLNIRNKIVYDYAQKLGFSHSPQGEWVNLYLNGAYAGLYLLSERNEIHPNRVDIAQEGSFLISMENKGNMDAQSLPYVELESTQVLRIRSSSVSDQELYRIWKTLRNALLSENGCDPVTGKHWMELIDLDSWVRKYLVEEIFANPDGGVVSQYFYMDGADPLQKIHAGPIWDYDYSMGGENWWMQKYPSYVTMNREYTDDGMYLPWFYELYRQEAFYSRLTELYETEFRPGLLELIQTGLDDYGAQIHEASVSDGIRWGYEESDIQAELAQIGTILKRREAFLTDLWITGSRYHIVRVKPDSVPSGYFAVREGDVLPQLPEDESSRSLGWYDAETEEPFDITQPIYKDLQIYAKREPAQIPGIHFIPAVVILMVLPCLLLWDRIQTKKNGRRRNDPAKVK